MIKWIKKKFRTKAQIESDELDERLGAFLKKALPIVEKEIDYHNKVIEDLLEKAEEEKIQPGTHLEYEYGDDKWEFGDLEASRKYERNGKEEDKDG